MPIRLSWDRARAPVVDNRMQILEVESIDVAAHDYDFDMKPPERTAILAPSHRTASWDASRAPGCVHSQNAASCLALQRA